MFESVTIIQFNSIQDYLYSAFHETIVAKQLYRKLRFYNTFIYCRILIYLTYGKIRLFCIFSETTHFLWNLSAVICRLALTFLNENQLVQTVKSGGNRGRYRVVYSRIKALSCKKGTWSQNAIVPCGPTLISNGLFQSGKIVRRVQIWHSCRKSQTACPPG